MTTIANNGYDKGARALTANVVLWARPETIVISRRAFLRLGRAQREVLRRAGREAAAPVRARIEMEQREALAEMCERGSLRLASASPSELAALRAAVRPVYRELERDPDTRKLIAEITRIKRGITSEPLRCRGGRDRRGSDRGPVVRHGDARAAPRGGRAAEGGRAATEHRDARARARPLGRAPRAEPALDRDLCGHRRTDPAHPEDVLPQPVRPRRDRPSTPGASTATRCR